MNKWKKRLYNSLRAGSFVLAAAAGCRYYSKPTVIRSKRLHLNEYRSTVPDELLPGSLNRFPLYPSFPRSAWERQPDAPAVRLEAIILSEDAGASQVRSHAGRGNEVRTRCEVLCLALGYFWMSPKSFVSAGVACSPDGRCFVSFQEERVLTAAMRNCRNGMIVVYCG